MVSIQSANELALSMPEAGEHRHFNLPAFKANKKIFATIHEDKHYMMVKLSLLDQSVICQAFKGVIFPVPGGWGRGGATFVDLRKVKKNVLKEALLAAWTNAASPRMKAKYAPKS